MNDTIAQALGFQNVAEFNRMVAAVDLSTPERLAAFRRWQDNDGSKDGLQQLPTPADPAAP